MTGCTGGVTFLGRAVPPSFVRTVVVIEPGAEHPYRAADWTDAIVAVERGELWLDGAQGGQLLVRRGDVLWLGPTPLRALRNAGEEPAVLVAVAVVAPISAELAPERCVTQRECVVRHERGGRARRQGQPIARRVAPSVRDAARVNGQAERRAARHSEARRAAGAAHRRSEPERS